MFFAQLVSLAVVIASAMGNTKAVAVDATVAATPGAVNSTVTPLGLGINCRGSSLCSGPSDTASLLVEYIDSISSGTFYNNGQQIACVANICAFLQNTNGETAGTIQNVASYITSHGCKVCGSVPIGYPSNNNVADGELTFNYVSNPACTDGVC